MKFKKTRQRNVFRDAKVGGWTLRLVARYTLLQLPGALGVVLGLILIGRWWPVPPWLFWSLIGLWVAKDMALFPFLWRAYDWDNSEISTDLLGRQGVVVRRLAPEGYIRIRGELWRAAIPPNSTPVEKGARVRVIDIEGLTLHVQSPDGSSPSG